MKFQTISVIGLGYIGLPTAAVLANRKKRVIGVDVNPVAVDAVNEGRVHIIEPDLEAVVQQAVSKGYLRATLTPEAADAFMIAVPTPFKDGNKPDLSLVEAATKSIAPVLRPGNVVILESTSPVGTTEQVAKWIAEVRPDLRVPSLADKPDIAIAYCPERVLPGHVLRELVENDRIIGGLTPECSWAAEALYRTFVRADCLITDARTAEMCKLTENSFRDVNIAFANELSLICDEQAIDVWDLIRLANRHPRVNILQPGPGVGGHCIAVDPWFIVSSAPKTARMIRTAREVNDGKPHWVIDKIKANLGRGRKKVAVFGLSFKADIDDLRESPAMEIAQTLAETRGVELLCVEPNIEELPKSLKGRARLVEIDEAIRTADLLVLLVDHREFKNVDKARLNGRRIIDTRGFWHDLSL